MAVRIALLAAAADRLGIGLAGLLGFQVRRHVKQLGSELIFRLAGVDPDVVRPRVSTRVVNLFAPRRGGRSR